MKKETLKIPKNTLTEGKVVFENFFKKHSIEKEQLKTDIIQLSVLFFNYGYDEACNEVDNLIGILSTTKDSMKEIERETKS